MKLKKNMRWAAIALGILGGSTNALACVVTPDSILTEGQTLQLVADCGTDLVDTINWKMAVGTGTPVSLTDDVVLEQTVAKPINYTVPVELASSGTSYYAFSVSGTFVSGATFSTSDRARVVVKPASTAIAVGQNTATTVNGLCGTPQTGTALPSMPTGTAQCRAGKPSLAISGPSSFTWSCLGLNGGTEANCYAVRGFTVTATAGSNGSISPSSQAVSLNGTASFTAYPNTNYSVNTISGCNGTRSGNSFTTGSVSADCIVTATFAPTPVNVTGACGSADGVLTAAAPSGGALCNAGSATSVTPGTNAYTWSCNGTGTGGNDSCQAPKGYMVTTSAGSNGSISASKLVAGGTQTTITVTPTGGYTATMGGTCGGNLIGTTYTTSAIASACTVTATFGVQTASATDPGVGKGLWIPPNTTGRVIADQSGTAASLLSFVPGCLNGEYITTNSNSGCGAKASFTGPVYGTGTSTTLSFGSGQTLGLRYMSKPNAGTEVKYFTLASGDGGNSGSLKVWMSDSATAEYGNTSSACKSTSTTQPYVVTGPGYCPIIAGRLYYLFMSTDLVGTNLRYQVTESQADFY